MWHKLLVMFGLRKPETVAPPGPETETAIPDSITLDGVYFNGKQEYSPADHYMCIHIGDTMETTTVGLNLPGLRWVGRQSEILSVNTGFIVGSYYPGTPSLRIKWLNGHFIFTAPVDPCTSVTLKESQLVLTLKSGAVLRSWRCHNTIRVAELVGKLDGALNLNRIGVISARCQVGLRLPETLKWKEQSLLEHPAISAIEFARVRNLPPHPDPPPPGWPDTEDQRLHDAAAAFLKQPRARIEDAAATEGEE